MTVEGGFVAQMHDDIGELLTLLISRTCKDVELELRLQPIDNEIFDLRTKTTSPEARLHIKAGGFWSKGVTAFFYIRVTHVNSRSNQDREPTAMIFKVQENEKKRKYQQRVLDVEMGSFTPLVFATKGGMGVECQMFLRDLAEELSKKDGEPYVALITWLRTRLSFEILRSVHLCVRGSRKAFRSANEVVNDFRLSVNAAEVFLN